MEIKKKMALNNVECPWMNWNKMSRQRAPGGDGRYLYSAQNWGAFLKNLELQVNYIPSWICPVRLLLNLQVPSMHNEPVPRFLYHKNIVVQFLKNKRKTIGKLFPIIKEHNLSNNQSYESYIKVTTVNQRAKDEGIALEKPTCVNIHPFFFFVQMSV